ncbi:hypothetical protein [Prosthecobacter sp.]|uniref:hypothetical protein n=1 Tax=Prosthecobacter sp. TaxID=1965333 RepID=UPI002AB946B6|nr:hypothetical protein [Prosthecobacter sp.]MDZ4404570.1 hypothetical protein [Prosthecobacter sp.]
MSSSALRIDFVHQAVDFGISVEEIAGIGIVLQEQGQQSAGELGAMIGIGDGLLNPDYAIE